ncbi:MAG: hypothetical protein B7733_19995 [Myxococcales bacterium FL481]|nr:MAG: hypothetical protein B7733_19995 [Myxococcales bacterium FL481]
MPRHLYASAPANAARSSSSSKTRRWLRRGGVATAALAALGASVMANVWTNLGTPPHGDRLEQLATSPQYELQRRRFVNALPVVDPPFVPTLVEWLRGGKNTAPTAPLPVETGIAERLATAPQDDLRVTWLGHSTTLVELDNVTLLTDPVWGDRASPWSNVGPQRFHAPPLDLEELPDIDAVIISHDHYDHLDAGTISRLAEQVPLFVTPLGVGSHLEYWGVAPDRIVELDWWGEYEVGGVRLVATPSRHFSGRAVLDRDKTLWAGWAMIGPRHRVYFSGDTGMFPGFAEIGERLGPFDIAMIESGAYNRLWADVHLGPEQAVQAFEAVRGKLLVPVHWGTFDLALHAWVEPAERILVAARTRDVAVAIPRPGESIEPGRPPAVVRWWPNVPWRTAQADPIVSSGLAGEPGREDPPSKSPRTLVAKP